MSRGTSGRSTPKGGPLRSAVSPGCSCASGATFDGAVQILDGRDLVTAYHVGPPADRPGLAEAAIRRPFLYPVNGPDGIGLTEFGKPHDPTDSHAHHYSLWIAHASVDGHDFWSDRGGVIAHDQLDLLEDGPVFCRLVQHTRWIAGDATVLREKRQWTFYRAAEDFRLMDVELELTPAGAKAVELGKTPFGLLAVRVAQSMTPFDGGGEILNARGDRNEQAAIGRQAEWLDQSGPIAQGSAGGEAGREKSPRPIRWGGIAVFDHPGNANHPTAWHCRNDGWAGAAFNMAGPYTIAAGGKLVLRYRLCLHRHDAVEARIARRWDEYKAQPKCGSSGGRISFTSSSNCGTTLPRRTKHSRYRSGTRRKRLGEPRSWRPAPRPL